MINETELKEFEEQLIDESGFSNVFEICNLNWNKIYEIIKNDYPLNITIYICMMIDFLHFETGVSNEEIIKLIAEKNAEVNADMAEMGIEFDEKN